MSKLTNADVLFLIRVLDAHLQHAYLMPTKDLGQKEFENYQAHILLKLRALDLDAVYSAEKERSEG